MGRHLLRALLLIVIAAIPALAQTTSATTATVIGTVADSSGGTLPGVTVNLSGTSMMGVQSTVTTEDGSYRFISVPPGEYKLTFDLPGFSTITREAVRLTANFTATINVTMGMAALQENVTVTGASPVVDTTSTSISTTFDKETLANLPSARDYWAILSEAPGVKMQRIDVGGSAAGTQTTYFVYGTTGQVRPMVEGINSARKAPAPSATTSTTAPSRKSRSAAARRAPRAPCPACSRSSSRSRAATPTTARSTATRNGKGCSLYNIDAAQVKAGVTGGGGLEPRDTNRLSSYSDKNADIGGFLMKDKAWWYASVRALDANVRYTNYPVEVFKTELRNLTVKGTYQLSQNNKLIGYYQPSSKVQPTRLDRQLLNATTAIHLATDDSFRQDYAPLLWKAEWNSILTPSTFFEPRAGAFGYDWEDTSAGNAPSYEDYNTNIVSGRARARDYLIPARNQVLGLLSYLSGWIGTHNFKVGGEFFRETQTAYRFKGSYNDVLHVLRSGVPSEGLLFEPAASENGLYVFGSYLQDNWKVNNRLTLNLGLRYHYYRNFLPEQTHEAFSYTTSPILFPEVKDLNHWNLPAPRLGFTYSLTDDGKTVLKGNYGKYWLIRARSSRPTTTRTRKPGSAATRGATATATSSISPVKKAGSPAPPAAWRRRSSTRT